ncbi:MAG: phosphatase PAP2 family protein [Sediminibacterium sp.]|nr:phosphatase PAP2 family protein [Sediminibacterium sp.]
MKIINNYITACTISILLLSSCKQSLDDRSKGYPSLNPTNIDLNAGDWKPVLLAAPNEFPLAAPLPTTNAAYLRELNEIKGYQQNITPSQQEIINYWSAGAVLRWNEIMRALVAKHNLPPYQNDDGTYPIPSAANPFSYPQFPFANPPYAARAYAYVAVAQYDALVAAYFYKRQYNRVAPYKVDAAIKPLVPTSDLAAYPSEDATVYAVTVEMLKLLFPADAAYIQQKADEHKLYRIIAGMNTRSDMDAGENLGRAVATKVIARAANDNMGKAVGTPAQWAALESTTAATGETPWISLENPRRPPMLPFFGRVRPFLFDSLTTIAIRPPAPPSVNSDQFKKELAEVKSFADNITREQKRIVAFWADGVGTYTPPGHWNAVAADDFVGLNFSEVRWARNMALLNMAIMDAGISCWDTKNYYFNPRPSQMDPSIKTNTGVPNFPAYISGHSTFSGAAATVLSYINPAKANDYNEMAKEASISRIYGALHYRSDCEVGLTQGKKVGDFAVARGKTDGAN